MVMSSRDHLDSSLVSDFVASADSLGSLDGSSFFSVSSDAPPEVGGASPSLTAPPLARSFFFWASSNDFLNSFASSKWIVNNE